jgi:hypothetical protein
MDVYPTLQELANLKGYELRHFTTPLKANEEFDLVVRPLDFSEKTGPTLNASQFYNDYYLYPIT